MRRAIVVFICGVTALPLAGQTVINLSHDLVRLGIANQNMAPDVPTQDAQPLFLAALQYIQNNPVSSLVADPGAYYFLGSVNEAVSVYFPPLSDLTIDFQGSALYFKSGMLRGFDIENCLRVTLQNFTIDYLAPPYTQVEITAIDPVRRTFTYTVMAGWADPKTFTYDVLGTPELLAVFFRDGALIPRTGLSFIAYPITGNTLAFSDRNSAPWNQSDVLSTLRPGDVMVVADDIGAEPISVVKCDSMLFSNIEIHGGIGAINLFDTANTTLDHIRVTPRPGGLLGSASGGLMFFDPLQNDHIRNSYVTRTLDDALGMGCDPPATVVSQTGTRQLTVLRGGSDHIPNGTTVNFVPVGSAAELSGGIVIAQDPPDTPDDVVNQIQVALTFDRDLPALSAGDQVFYASPAMRGSGSTVEDNLVESIPVGRGLYIGGMNNLVVQRNVIRGTSNAGIDVSEVSLIAGGGGAPSQNVTIQSNAIEDVLGPQAAGSGGIGVSEGGIVVSSQDDNFDFVTGPVNSNVSILNNFVAGSGRTGIWIGELSDSQVNNNVIVRWNQHPELMPEGVNPFPGDFAQPFVVRFSQNVSTGGNVMDAASALAGPVSLSPASASVDPGGQSGTFLVQSNVPNFSWSARSDSLWLTVTGSNAGAGDGSLAYSAAANPSGSPRTGSITLGGVSFTVTQAASPSAPAFLAAGVSNAAGYSGGVVSPGEIVTIFGSNLGPGVLAGAKLDSAGKISTELANTQVLFDGVAAPVIYASANQTSAVVPYSVQGPVQENATHVVVSYNGRNSAAVALTVAASAPGLFTADSSGKGPGAFLNSDGRLNTPANPAAKGSIVTLFETGEGATLPPGVDGKLAVAPYPVPSLPVVVAIDGLTAEVEYKGGAPGEVAGVMQINVKVPAAARSGSVPVTVTVGSAASQSLVTLAVQ